MHDPLYFGNMMVHEGDADGLIAGVTMSYPETVRPALQIHHTLEGYHRVGGMDLLRQVSSAHPDVPVIMITAHGTVDTAAEAMKAGAFDYITKPFEQDDLRKVIALYEASAVKLNCPDFGLRLSAHHGLERLGGPLALVTYNAPTVADSINLASLYMPYLSPNMQYMLAADQTRGRDRLIHELKVDHCPERRHQLEMAMRVAAETLSLLAQSQAAE